MSKHELLEKEKINTIITENTIEEQYLHNGDIDHTLEKLWIIKHRMAGIENYC
jgi:hypothetical protein